MSNNIADNNLRNEVFNKFKFTATKKQLAHPPRVEGASESLDKTPPANLSRGEIMAKESLAKLEKAPEGKFVKHVDFDSNGQWLVKYRGKIYGFVRNQGHGGNAIDGAWYVGPINKWAESQIEGPAYYNKAEAVEALQKGLVESVKPVKPVKKGIVAQCLEHQMKLKSEDTNVDEDIRKKIVESIDFSRIGKIFKKRK